MRIKQETAQPAAEPGDAGPWARRCCRALRPRRRAEPPRCPRHGEVAVARYPLPYAFARGNQLLLEDDGQAPDAVACRRARAQRASAR